MRERAYREEEEKEKEKEEEYRFTRLPSPNCPTPSILPQSTNKLPVLLGLCLGKSYPQNLFSLLLKRICPRLCPKLAFLIMSSSSLKPSSESKVNPNTPFLNLQLPSSDDALSAQSPTSDLVDGGPSGGGSLGATLLWLSPLPLLISKGVRLWSPPRKGSRLLRPLGKKGSKVLLLKCLRLKVKNKSVTIEDATKTGDLGRSLGVTNQHKAGNNLSGLGDDGMPLSNSFQELSKDHNVDLRSM
ncbi:hypothetical protein Cgig2_015066 [Carnegiea gigantea]|uniref:Uncharacterized protein n=1 Tax=Carnegiea gigantea TaxID=171969 RepID=A0A9Q1K6J5_9CARY|nr:hypothetical protein Cgig2_015066 [Carnegiea gigantea]